MSVLVPVKDGKVVDNTASQDSLAANKKAGGGLDKEAFLQLLVAQMKYQDPLEPTSNTEYILISGRDAESEWNHDNTACNQFSR